MIRLAKKSVVVAALMASTSAIASGGWSVSEASGSVTITRGEKVIQARKNSRLNEGDVIRTGKGARAVLVRGKEYLVVSPKAHIRIAEPEKAGPVTQIFQYLGNVLFKIEKKSTPHFGVETPYMAAVVKGTTFNVSVGDDGTSVQVTEGAVEVTTGDDLEAALLTPGLVGLVEADAIGDLIIISNDPDGPGAEEATVRGKPSFVPALSQPAAEPVTRIANAATNSDGAAGASNVTREQPFARPVAARPTPQPDAGGESVTSPGLQFAIGAASGGEGASLDQSNDAIPDSSSEEESSAVQDFVISEPGDGESGPIEIVTEGEGNTAAPVSEESDSGIDVDTVDVGTTDENGSPANDTGLVYAEDQPNGSCAGVPNCSGGENPNNGDPSSGDADVGLDAGVGGPADDSDSEEVDIGADLGLGSSNDGSDDDTPGNGNGNSGGNNGNANGIGNGNGGGNGNGNNGNGNGNGGPSSDDDGGSDDGVGVDLGVDVGGDDGEDVDLGVDLGLGLGGDDDDDDAGERGERGESGERGRSRGNNDDDDDADEGGERGEGGNGRGRGRGRGNND